MIENVSYLELIYARCRNDPKSVSAEWRENFKGTMETGVNGNWHAGPTFVAPSVFHPSIPGSQNRFRPDPREAGLHERLQEMIQNHRRHGHRIAAIDPLAVPRPPVPELELDYYGFSENELGLLTAATSLPFDTPLTVREIFERLQKIYCCSTGVQFMHIEDASVRDWLQRRMEDAGNGPGLSHEEQLRLLKQLTEAAIFDEFLRKTFPGAKTFSMEGCETLLPLVDLAIEKAASQGVENMVIGMTHRGRLNMLAHVAGKSPGEIFREFSDAEPERWQGYGDVKHHLGHSTTLATTSGRKVHISLCFNPSHLEFINPVVLGRTRARQDRSGDHERSRVLSLLIHGDAAFCGEGIVPESLNLSKLAGYAVGGTLHVIINNHLGFTTLPTESRSAFYATDVARLLPAPIFHVNGEDPPAVAQVVRLALDFRHQFRSDVFINLYGYRRWGHNESDEPSFTQPVLYRQITKRKSVREGCLGHLQENGGVTMAESEAIDRQCRDTLEKALAAGEKNAPAPELPGQVAWANHVGSVEPQDEPETGVETDQLAHLLRRLAEVPAGFHLHPKLERGLQARREMAEGKHPLDWAAAEALALATLANQGVRIRLTGQDTARGTFSHRHAVFYDYDNGFPYAPLQHLANDQAPVEIINSPLSEAGALGFEYGYSLDCPDGLVLWEAQFGDFVNVAQVILDQFISSAEDKWNRLSGLVLLLPHGFEGMGAEHSSARIERFLTLAARDNIQIAQPTTPAQYFHLLRRQSLWRWRKPLVIFTPKGLLRHPKSVSHLSDFTQGRFQRILPDADGQAPVKRLLLCTGKIFYDLAAYREATRRDDVAILRLEQLYPLRIELLEKELKRRPEGTPVFWVQEEPANMGAWRFLHERFGKHLFGRWPFARISRPESASPATGSAGAHKLEQQRVVRHAFGDGETAVSASEKKEK